MDPSQTPFALRLPHAEAVKAVMDLVRTLSPDPADPLVNLRTAEEIALKLLPLNVEQQLVEAARARPEGATWEEIGAHLISARRIEGPAGPDIPLSPSAAFGRFGPTAEQRSRMREVGRPADSEVLPGMGRQEMADELGVSVNTVVRKAAAGELIVRTVTSRRGRTHKRYFKLGSPEAAEAATGPMP